MVSQAGGTCHEMGAEELSRGIWAGVEFCKWGPARGARQRARLGGRKAPAVVGPYKGMADRARAGRKSYRERAEGCVRVGARWEYR
jgi:hypothetical protein